VARAKISLPVSALKQDDDALGLINFFATGNRPRPNANYRRSPSAMRTRQVQNALDILAEPSLQLVNLSAGSGSGKYDSMWLNQDKPVPVAGHVTFFTRGWLQVLTDSEIWNWLVWRHRPQVPVREANGAGRPDAGGGNRFFSARSLVGVPRLVRFTPTGDSGLHSLRCRAAARRPHRFREPTLQQHSSGPVGGASTGAGIGA